jgi:hypothetical protein
MDVEQHLGQRYTNAYYPGNRIMHSRSAIATLGNLHSLQACQNMYDFVVTLSKSTFSVNEICVGSEVLVGDIKRFTIRHEAVLAASYTSR